MPLASLSSAAREEVRRLLHGPCDPSLLSSLHKALSADSWSDAAGGDAPGDRLLRRLGRLGDLLPAADRVFEDPARLSTVHAWTAVADPSLCLAALVHHTLCLGSMVRLTGEPGERLKRRMEALRSGRVKGTYLITEAGQANSHLATRTRAEFDRDTGEFVLHTPDPQAAKFGSAGTLDVPQTAVVLARLLVDGEDRGVFAFVVDLTGDEGLLPGVEVSSPLGLGALPLDYVLVRFHHVRVPYADWLADGAGIGSDGGFHDPAGSSDRRLQRTLRVGQGLWATMPAVAAATARQSAVQAVNYARQRRTQSSLAPGAPLLAYRTQQRAVLGALADAFALTCAAGGARAVWMDSLAAPMAPAGEGAGAMGFTPWAAVSRPLAAYKAVAVRLAARVTADCQSRCGFSGHLDVNRLAAYHGFHHAFDAAGGDSQLVFYDIGRSLTEEAGAAGTAPPAPSVTSVTSPHWWPATARRHQDGLTRHLSERLRALGRSGPFDAWNPLLEDAGVLGELYANALVAEDVARTVDGMRDRDLARVLQPLAALHGVMAARRWSGSLLARGTLRPADVRGLTDVADGLCDAIVPHLPLLTEAFAHPEDIVAAPLAATDYDTALRATLTWTRGGAR
ncbi:acyl-CoA dehydrogenase [Streptomyces griseus]|uniref:acyl-CoA dehydrogenase n=1 Tax=Streptomyces griseus TaxID=1911 RepID=UPI000689828B|nr:acyl-CoA dehydrogenase [Streptomyces griseus]